jgi:glycosyltransferase involved in cell wall biosynthesis
MVELLHVDFDDPETLARERLRFAAARESADYRAVFSIEQPLVTVCITTSDRAALLSERALTSISRQTYRNLQVIVVGDCCSDDTADRVAALRDSRFSFINLPERGPYPPPGQQRNRVAGTNPANEALRRAEGQLITHIDEDDTFTDDRIAVLVAALQAATADVVYHPFWWENEDSSWRILGDGTFRHGETGTSMVLYHGWLSRVPWDINAYRLGEPGDWNRFRKFAALGAKTCFVPRCLTWHWRYPIRDPFSPKPGETFLEPSPLP